MGTSRELDYSYDERGRLIGVAEDLTVLSDYAYDPNGNRLSHTAPDGTDAGAYDDQDRLLSYGDFTFTYGENGELETKTDTVTSDVTSYVYDARGSLLSVTLPDTTVIEYVIDGRGRRVGKKVDGAPVQGLLYKDQLRIAAELDAAGEVVSHFSYIGGSHSPDWMTKGGELYRFVKDQVGSVRLVVNALTGDVAQELEYDEFGVVLSDSNPGFQPFGFAGGLYDVDTGLTRFGARDYDATVGRWTSKDPIRWSGGQLNVYVYVRGDPVNFIDPAGLFFCNLSDVPILVGGGIQKDGGDKGAYGEAWVQPGQCVGPGQPIPTDNGGMLEDVDVIDLDQDGAGKRPMSFWDTFGDEKVPWIGGSEAFGLCAETYPNGAGTCVDPSDREVAFSICSAL